MLKQKAFANAIAIVSGLAYALFYLLNLIAPAVFRYVFNAQFLGADIAAFVPAGFSFETFLGILVTALVFGWIVGYLLAWLYNWFAKQ